MRSLNKLRDGLLRLFFDAREYSPKYAVSVHVLIKRAENRMVLKYTPNCPFCTHEMMFRFSHIVPIIPIRDDQVWKCPCCYHTTHFGIPMTKEAYQEEFNLRRGQYLMNPTARLSERKDQEVIERLRALGYLA